ncbi:anti-sigma factor family protein [Spirillospora sp. CA-294931]|uniref:anti-sigma factor family protein n=1 Tax=Spirillospora sp. CA-294931 TaxID=3240042 RepID=UPI003D8A2A0E
MGGIDCGDYRLGLGVFALGRLTGAEAGALSAHLRACPSCRAELAALREVVDLLRRVRKGRGAGRGSRTGASLPLSGACVSRRPAR